MTYSTRQLLMPACVLVALTFPLHAKADQSKAAYDAATVVSESSGLALDLSDYQVLLNTLSREQAKQLAADPQKLTEMVLDYHSNRDLANKARAAGIADRPAVKYEIQNLIDGLLIRTYVNELVTNAAVPKSLERLAKERYVTSKEKYKLPERRRVSHILFPKINPTTGKPITEDFIQKIRLDIVDKPDEFSKYVREYSVDLGTTEQNGKIDQWLAQDGTMVKSFEGAAFELSDVGEISQPVKTDYGLHLIRLDAIEGKKQLVFADVKNSIMKQLLEEKAASIRAAARAKSYPDLSGVNFDALKQALTQHIK